MAPNVRSFTLICLLQTENLLLTWTPDVTTVEICGALKNILSVAAGIVDGLKLGANTKSAIIRLGLYEMGQYCHCMYGKYGEYPSHVIFINKQAF